MSKEAQPRSEPPRRRPESIDPPLDEPESVKKCREVLEMIAALKRGQPLAVA